MTVLRRLLPLCASVLLMAVFAAPALAQSAGDDQYSDPLAGQGSGTAPKPSAPSTSSTPMPGLSTTPQAATGSGTSSSAAAPSAVAAPAPGSATAAAAPGSELPRTGADVWLVALLGVVLVLTGIGLRLRTADGRG